MEGTAPSPLLPKSSVILFYYIPKRGLLPGYLPGEYPKGRAGIEPTVSAVWLVALSLPMDYRPSDPQVCASS
jgi:hypothetical protein